MVDVIRECVRQIEKRIDYWIEEGELSPTEIAFILQELDNMCCAEDEDEDEEEEYEEET